MFKGGWSPLPLGAAGPVGGKSAGGSASGKGKSSKNYKSTTLLSWVNTAVDHLVMISKTTVVFAPSGTVSTAKNGENFLAPRCFLSARAEAIGNATGTGTGGKVCPDHHACRDLESAAAGSSRRR